MFLIALSTFVMAQEDIVHIRLLAPQNQFVAGKSYDFAVEVDVSGGWHINADKPLDPMSIPTVLKVETGDPGITLGRIRYPKAVNRKFSFSDNIINVFEGKSLIYFSLSLNPDLKPGDYLLKAQLDYQGCNDASCLPPNSANAELKIKIVPTEEGITPLNTDIFSKKNQGEEPVETVTEEGSGNEDIGRIYEEQGIVLYLLLVFIAGLALNLTPCVFPLIPITISYFGNKAEGDAKKRAIHGTLYMLGMAITYSLLGTIAAMAGSIIGGALQNPIVIILIVIIILALAASMFGAFEIRVPQKLAQIGGANRSGYGGTLLMGLTVGIIAAPCIGPFVLALVTFVAQVGNWFFGFISFFVLALGLGLPYAILAMFSSKLNTLPRAGMWMVWVRNIFGFILVGLAIYFLNPLVKNEVLYLGLMAVNFFIGGIFLGFIDKTTGTGKAFTYLKYLVGIIFILIGLNYALDANKEYLLDKGGQEAATHLADWEKYSEEALTDARRQNKPVLIDFYADWCEPCKELDKITFRDEKFLNQAKDFVLIKADLTDNKNEKVEALRKKYNVRGVPTLVLIDREGNIAKNVVGFQDAATLSRMMQKVKGKNGE